MASAVQYTLLAGFATVAAGISSQGLTRFARENMGLRGVWPYCLFLALDGAAGVCAVLLTRRAARAESAVGPRLAVWGLVAASSSFNMARAPHHPGASEAFGLMPVIAAVLFEFTLHDLRLRSVGQAGRRLTVLHLLHPAEYLRVGIHLAADNQVSAHAAARSIRVSHAARRLYILRRALRHRDGEASHHALATRRARFAERRAHAALARADFTDPAIAAEILGRVQMLTLTSALARLDYTTAGGIQAALANMITAAPTGQPLPTIGTSSGPASRDDEAVDNPPPDAATPSAAGRDENLDGPLVAAAALILTEAAERGERVSQKALGDKLRAEGHRVANHNLNWLMTAASPTARDQCPGARPSLQAKLPGVAPPAAARHAEPETSDYQRNGTHPPAATGTSPQNGSPVTRTNPDDQ